jgi:hypothetical protein
VSAEKYFKRDISLSSTDLWINSKYRFLAESLIAQGKITEAKGWLVKADSQGAKARLKNLDQSFASEILTPFISY